jgi:glutamine amidotransferase PdxT
MIGVLALQGAFIEHVHKFKELGVDAKEVSYFFAWIMMRDR